MFALNICSAKCWKQLGTMIERKSALDQMNLKQYNIDEYGVNTSRNKIWITQNANKAMIYRVKVGYFMIIITFKTKIIVD